MGRPTGKQGGKGTSEEVFAKGETKSLQEEDRTELGQSSKF